MIQLGLCLHLFKELASADNFQLYLLFFAMIYVKVYGDFSWSIFWLCLYARCAVKLKIYITYLSLGWIIPFSNAHVTY